MVSEAAFLTVDIWTPIVWTRMLFTFGALILSCCIVPRSGQGILGSLLHFLPLLRILIKKGLTEMCLGSEGSG